MNGAGWYFRQRHRLAGVPLAGKLVVLRSKSLRGTQVLSEKKVENKKPKPPKEQRCNVPAMRAQASQDLSRERLWIKSKANPNANLHATKV